ncbi:MAG: hypothetical protein Q9159_003110 [Coniocarpon cinnabarinum]
MSGAEGFGSRRPGASEGVMRALQEEPPRGETPLGTQRFQRGATRPRTESNIQSGADRSAEARGRKPRSHFAQQEQVRRDKARTQAVLDNQAARAWKEGDVYAPHDLSPAEQMKARSARLGLSSRFRMQTRARSRRLGGADAFDVLRLDPVKEYKNYTMMGEFVSETGRIRSARETGLRAVNQRKLAKAVRRSIGMGLVPSVHRHPELFPERKEQRDAVWIRNERQVSRRQKMG